MNQQLNTNPSWRTIGYIILSIRFVQGWIFWGGGSRRFIYDPEKLNPYAPEWMANKLQSTMPGALLGLDHVVSFLLQHFFLLYPAIILFSLVELISGLALMFGVFTRAAAGVTALISISLMLLFGWQGTTCLDEWTMASCNFAMAVTLMISGGACFSLDAYWLRKKPELANKRWFQWCCSAPLSRDCVERWGKGLCVVTMVFSVATYAYFRGAVFTPYHAGPVSADTYHIQLTQGTIARDGLIRFSAYVDAGPPAAPLYIMRAELVNTKGRVQTSWSGKVLHSLPDKAIDNIYAYNQIKRGRYGLMAPVSAKAFIQLQAKPLSSKGPYELRLYTINGARFELPLALV